MTWITIQLRLSGGCSKGSRPEMACQERLRSPLSLNSNCPEPRAGILRRSHRCTVESCDPRRSLQPHQQSRGTPPARPASTRIEQRMTRQSIHVGLNQGKPPRTIPGKRGQGRADLAVSQLPRPASQAKTPAICCESIRFRSRLRSAPPP